MVNDVTLVDGDGPVDDPGVRRPQLAGLHGHQQPRPHRDRCEGRAGRRLKPLAKNIDRPAVERHGQARRARRSCSASRRRTVGRSNASKTTTAVVNALRARALGNLAVDAPVTPVLTVDEAALTTDQAKAAIPKMKAISTWTTNYQPSERNGNGANIRIPTTTINGYVVNPGETFSFWKAVGPVTRELGYTRRRRDHRRPHGAAGRPRRRHLLLLHHAVQRRAPGRVPDGRPPQPLLLHQPLSARARRDGVHQRERPGAGHDLDERHAVPVVIQGINGKAFVKFVVYSVPNGRTTDLHRPDRQELHEGPHRDARRQVHPEGHAQADRVRDRRPGRLGHAGRQGRQAGKVRSTRRPTTRTTRRSPGSS